ncbi:MAG TPA: hypothetical protein VGM63_05485 [Mucilaginibacter sp.]
MKKLSNMKPFPEINDAGAIDTLKEYLEALIIHLRTKVNAGSQLDIAKTLGIDDSALSKLISKDHRKKPINLLTHFENILKVYQVDFNKSNGSFSAGKVPPKEITPPTEQYFIGGPEGYNWRIMVEIWNRKTEIREIGIRYLKIKNLTTDVEFLVDLEDHDDYVGKGQFIFSGHQLRFLFTIRGDEEKSKLVYLRFITGSKSAKPTLMSGVMVHNYLDKNSNSAYIIFAENVSKEDGPFQPLKMDFEKFRKWRPDIAHFFDLHNTFIHCPKKIKNFQTLREHNSIREKENREIDEKKAAAALIKNLANVSKSSEDTQEISGKKFTI